MKKIRLPKIALALVPMLALAAPLPSIGAPENVREHPGYVDLGTFAPASSGGEFVEINLGKALLSLAAKITAREEPDVSDLLDGIHAVRVNVVSLDDQNRDELQARATEIASRLASESWERVVTVSEEKQDVNVFAKLAEDGETIHGLTVVVLESGNEAVFVNIVGNIRPEQIATVANSLDIEPLRQLKLNHRDGVES